jgi:hypothetical protein
VEVFGHPARAERKRSTPMGSFSQMQFWVLGLDRDNPADGTA